MTSNEIIKLVLETTGQQGLVELAEKAKEATKALEGVGKSVEGVEKKTFDLQGLLTQGKGLVFAVQGGDFSEVIDGISGVVKLIPGLNSFAPAIEKIGDVVKKALPIISDWRAKWEEANKIVREAVTSMDDYTKAVNINSVALAESEATSASRKADAAAKAVPSTRQQERAATFGALTLGREIQIKTDIFQAIREDREGSRIEEAKKIDDAYRAKIKSIDKQSGLQPDFVNDFMRAQAASERQAALGKVGEGEQGQAESLFKKAQSGDANALLKLQRLLPKGSTASEIVRMSSPEEQEASRLAKRDVAEQEQQNKDRLAQESGMAAAREKVRANIKADTDRKTHEAEERAKSTGRGRELVEKQGAESAKEIHEKAMEELKRIGPQSERARFPAPSTSLPSNKDLAIQNGIIANQALIAERFQEQARMLSRVNTVTGQLKGQRSQATVALPGG